MISIKFLLFNAAFISRTDNIGYVSKNCDEFQSSSYETNNLNNGDDVDALFDSILQSSMEMDGYAEGESAPFDDFSLSHAIPFSFLEASSLNSTSNLSLCADISSLSGKVI